MNTTKVTEFLEGCGWLEIPSKNQHMISFKREDEDGRINFYFGTGTLTYQYPFKKIKVWREILTVEMLENSLLEIK